MQLVFGAMLGTLTTLLWNAFLQPRIIGRSLAEVLAADMSLRLQSIAAEKLQREHSARTVPVRNPVPTMVFRAVVGRIAELPRGLVGDVILTYQIFERLNETSDRANALIDRLREVESTDATTAGSLNTQLAECLANYERLLDNSGTRINDLQPRLIAAARPWWSIRRIGAPPPQSVTAEDLLPKMDELRRARDDGSKKIGDSSDPHAI